MISALSQKLVDTSQVFFNERNCLRNRLRGHSCRRCVDICKSRALTENSGKVVFNLAKCTGCGICVAACPGEVFSFEGFNLSRTLKGQVEMAGLVVSCHGGRYRAENELRLPCVGVLPAEALVFWGRRQRGDVWFNLSECSECSNRWAADYFLQVFRHVQKLAGHLFRTRLLPVPTEDGLPQNDQRDRREFLASLGNNVVEAVQQQFSAGSVREEQAKGSRRIPARTQLLSSILRHEHSGRHELMETCTPDADISSSCNLCPRCTGMCPTGALKVKKNNSEKELAYDRTLCTGCGLCVEFCKEQAIVIRKPSIAVSAACGGDRPPVDN